MYKSVVQFHWQISFLIETQCFCGLKISLKYFNLQQKKKSEHKKSCDSFMENRNSDFSLDSSALATSSFRPNG